MRSVLLFDDAAAAFLLVLAVVTVPLLSQNFQSEVAPLAAKAVGRRAQADDRLARIEIRFKVFHFIRGRRAESRGDNHQVGLCQRRHAGQTLLIVGVDVLAFRIKRKEYFAIVAVLLTQDLGQHRQRFFRAVLFVTADQHHGLALARAVLACKL